LLDGHILGFYTTSALCLLTKSSKHCLCSSGMFEGSFPIKLGEGKGNHETKEWIKKISENPSSMNEN